jgi:mono/diheme cytochrome c family protein
MRSLHRLFLILAILLAVAALSWGGPRFLAGPGWAAAQGKRSDNPLSGDPAAIAAGMQLFRSGFCGHCHGMNARGGGRGAPNAANLQKFKRGYSAFVKTVKNGYKSMPAWGGGPVLSDDQINRIGAWLETLAQPEANWKDPE